MRCSGGIGGDVTMASTSQGIEGDGAEPEQARRGRCNDDVAGEVEREVDDEDEAQLVEKIDEKECNVVHMDAMDDVKEEKLRLKWRWLFLAW